MASRKEVLCNHCGFPVRRGVLPIIWPGADGKAKAYCSIECWEAVSGRPFPEPFRSEHMEVESCTD